MKLGISLSTKIPVEVTKNSNFLEIKKFTRDEIKHTQNCMSPGRTISISLHLQYLKDGKYILPTIEDFSTYIEYFSEAVRALNPEMISFHFGLSSKSVVINEDTFVAVADGALLARREITENIERNLEVLKKNFSEKLILIENLEYIPEYISKGGYSYIQEADFFTENLKKWQRMGIVDGMVFDISHAIIASANHPFYNGYMNHTEGAIDVRKLPELKSKKYSKYLKSLNGDKVLECFKNYLGLFPEELIKEIHISGSGRLEDGTYVDAHLIPGRFEKLALIHTIEIIKEKGLSLPPVVLEYTREPIRIPEILEDLRKALEKAG